VYAWRQQCISPWYLHLVTAPVNICRSLLSFSFPSTWRCWCELLGSYLSEVFASLCTAIHDDMTVLLGPHSSKNHSCRKEVWIEVVIPLQLTVLPRSSMIFWCSVPAYSPDSRSVYSPASSKVHMVHMGAGYKCLRARRTSQRMFEHNSIQL